MAVTQNFENEASMKTGRTGGLPYVGIGFDGAMSEARVYVNGEQVCFWPYGYSSFWCDVTDVLTDGDNVLAVRLENLPQSSRWYPGAGLYRNVHLITTGDVHIPVWGTRVTTPDVDSLSASVRIETKVENADGKDLLYVTVKVMDKDGNLCPADSREMEFSVSGAASYRASANGDPTCLYIFHKPVMPAFNGMLTVIVCSGDAPGKAILTVRAKGLRPASLDIEVR